MHTKAVQTHKPHTHTRTLHATLQQTWGQFCFAQTPRTNTNPS
jgi:hypothetical protein